MPLAKISRAASNLPLLLLAWGMLIGPRLPSTVASAQMIGTPVVDDVTKGIYKVINPGHNLRDEAEAATQDVILRVAPGRGMPLGLEEFPAETTELNHLGYKTCAADLVVIGRLKSRASSFSTDGSAIFTVYSMSVQEILRQSARSHAATSTTISVSRLGGSVRVNDHFASLMEAGVDRLDLGTLYLLFLKLIPGSDTYQAFSRSSLNAESQTVTSIYGHKQLTASLDKIRSHVALTEPTCGSGVPNGALEF